MIAWLVLVAAGLCEMLGVTFINAYTNKKNVGSLVAMILAFSMSFILLSYAMGYLSMSTSYAVWTGIGAAGGAVVGMLFYHEPKNAPRIFFILLILGSTIGLKLVS